MDADSATQDRGARIAGGSAGQSFRLNVINVDVDGVGDIAGCAKIFGREMKVRCLDGAGYRLLIKMATGARQDPEQILSMYELVGRCCPDLSEDEVWRLTPHKLGAILAIAQAPIASQAEFTPSAGSVTRAGGQPS